MKIPTTRRRAVAAAAICAISIAILVTTSTTATAAGSGYTVSSGSVVQVGHPEDTPASPFVDKNGTFYFQQSVADYGATAARSWDFYSGTTFDNATRSAISDSVNPANSSDSNKDTTWRCNNSPTGLTATAAPSGSSYAQRNYCDLSGVWVDPDTGNWYGLVHNEFTPQPFGDGLHYDAIDYAVSTDQGSTWTIKDHAITSPYSTQRGDVTSFPNQAYYYGDGDQRLVVDTASGYFYVFYGSRVINKNGGWAAAGFGEHVARAPISQKMAKGSWQKYSNGGWTSAGIGGSESNITSTSEYPTGVVPAMDDYNPQNTGTISTQAAAGELPANGSDLFVMNVSYDAYLGMYIGTPQTDLGDGVNRPLHFYGTRDLATERWTDLGATPNYTQQSWYRWLVDTVNATSSSIVGKTFRSYCYFACSTAGGSTSQSEYVNVTVDTATPAAPIADTSKAYTIASGSNRTLAQSVDTQWVFTPTGDGAYSITNSVTGMALGVDSTTVAGRAWGAPVGLMARPSNGPTVGQQWFVEPDVSTPSSGASTSAGTSHLVNRYSGQVLSLGASGVSTSPYRNWANTGTTGSTALPADQALTVTAASSAIGLKGTESGRCLDVPNSSTANGTAVVVWDCNGGANQTWALTGTGALQVYGSKCLDVQGGAAANGAAIAIDDCTGSAEQSWRVLADGSVLSALNPSYCLDVANHATANLSALDLWTCNGGNNQKWTWRF